MPSFHEKQEAKAFKKRNRMKNWEERKERSKLNRDEVVELQQKIDALKEEDGIPEELPTHFDQLPLCQRTQLGLERGNFKKLTTIQQESMLYSLSGRDVLGAAKTGSGKTLCFIIPILDRLYLEKWSTEDGVGAMVLSPTRELALQIFKILQVVGYKHTFSAALLTGGRDVKEERKRLHAISIVVGTPGRILQHLSEDSNITTDNLQMLVMDEADRLLDMGFRDTINGILDSIPRSRQTLLFSATQTQDVKMLAEMSLKNPKFIAAHAESLAPTPSRMNQNFMVVELHRKLDALLMFIKRHPNDKIVVFINTCNQVKFMYLAFSKILKKMRVPSMCLTGKMKQFRREEVFLTFCRCKSAVLFCTDIAARGLDFPMVHWVLQYDCPDSPQTYIHRVGRTARAGARGATVLFLTPREVPMLNFLEQKKVPLREIAVKPNLLQESKEIFVALVVQGLKYEAQKAFTAYLRSLHFAANKAVFDIDSVNVEKFAHSLGLLVVPNMAELQNIQRSAKNVSWDVLNFIQSGQKALGTKAANVEGGDDDDSGNSADDEAAPASKENLTRRERHLKASDMFRQLHMKQDRYAAKKDGEDSDEEGDGDFFTVKRRTMADLEKEGKDKSGVDKNELTYEERLAGLSKNKKRKLIQEADLRVKDLGLSKHTVFSAAGDEDEDGSDDDDDLNAVGGGLVVKKLEGLRQEMDGDEDEESFGGSGDEFTHEESLRNRVARAREEDTARQKAVRRQRQLKKAGKLDKDGDGGAKDGNDSDSSDLSYDSDTLRLLKAARGELSSSSEDDDDAEYSESEDEVAEAPPKNRKRK